MRATGAAVAKLRRIRNGRSSTAGVTFKRSRYLETGRLCGPKLSVVVNLPGGVLPIRRSGHTLPILQKQQGKWVLTRDANVLSPV
ncbi:MAG: hypothetical protein ACREIM_06995 [Nitrospiraceae bacterium]